MNNPKRRKKPYVVITRPEPGLSETAHKICLLGWQPLLMPVMRIQTFPINSFDVHSIQAIIFTSRQAISPTIQQLLSQHFAYQNFPVFTVGDSTAQEAKQAGFVNVTSASKDAVALAKLLSKKLSPDKGRLLFPSAKGQGQLLMTLLKQAEFSVLHSAVYSTEPVKELSGDFFTKLQSESIQSILFFSSETARFFIELIPEHLQKQLQTIQAVGISSKAKKILERVSWRSIDIAANPNTEEMLCVLKEHF